MDLVLLQFVLSSWVFFHVLIVCYRLGEVENILEDLGGEFTCRLDKFWMHIVLSRSCTSFVFDFMPLFCTLFVDFSIILVFFCF